MGLCGTTHERVCGLGSCAGRQLGAVTQIDPCFGLICKSEGYKNLFNGKEMGERGIEEKPL